MGARHASLCLPGRTAWEYYQRRHPEEPWLTPEANRLLDGLLRKTDRAIEFGSGRSTIWFAKRVQHLISVETDRTWYERIRARLSEEGLSNVDYRHCPTEGAWKPPNREWLDLLGELREEECEFVLVDGPHRDHCAMCALEVLRIGGILALDNANWFLPSRSVSPRSKPWDGAPHGELWAEFAAEVEDWRCVWTSQGVSDTALWIRPEAGSCAPSRTDA